LCVISTKTCQNKCYYSPNKILIAGITYYSSENNKNINETKILKRKEYKKWKHKKSKVESKKMNKEKEKRNKSEIGNKIKTRIKRKKEKMK
jgi:hypothetical protein